MSQAQKLYQWQQRVATFFPDLPASRLSWLALVSFGIVLAQSALLNSVTLRLTFVLGQSFNTVRQRLRKLYRPQQGRDGSDCSFDYTACFASLLRWATAGFSDHRVALAIDPTNLGDRFTILTVSVVFRGGAIPVAWDVRLADAKGSWNDQWRRLLTLLQTELGEGWQVLVLSDRGLESKELFESITALGWHPFMRVKKAGHFLPEGWHKSQPMHWFAGQLASRWRGRGVAWPKSSGLPCTLLACWEEGHEEPWLIVTDLTEGSASALWYGWRSWIEQGFRDLKSDGWDLSKTRMTEPDRVARWWTAAALATLWVMEAGAEAQRLEIPATRSHVGAGKGAVTSVFRLGMLWLADQLGQGRLRNLRRLPQQPWPNDPTDWDSSQRHPAFIAHPAIPL